ncbi:restriction endonuclease subunit S [Microbacterium sp. TWP3-1-2b2]|uniref:restriction endonuclease subunit S n=1 Tax=Microbacterium sp. TWP3-1-2b2 TaxID=2804651 RepID=UPI003CF91D00
MSYIDELIAEYCPEGVEFLSIEDLFDLRNGYTPSKANPLYWEGGSVPWFRMEDIRENGGILTTALQQIPEVAVKGGKIFPANSLLVATSATIGEHALVTVPHLSNQRFTSLSPKEIYSRRLDMKFAYYYAFVLDDWCRNNTTTSSFASVDMSGFRGFKFPLPPLPVQRAIVETLDTFSLLEAELEVELEAELEARRQQFDFYRREKLNRVRAESASLASLGKWQGGITPSKSELRYWTDGDIPWLASMDISDESTEDIRGRVTEAALRETSLKIVPAPSVAVVMRSNILRRRLPIGLVMVDTTVNQDVRALIPREGVDAEYVYQAMRAGSEEIRGQCVRTDGSMAAVNSQDLFAWRIPLPSYKEQRRIAAELRSFEVLFNNLSVGLPDELAARRKQYEYYRDRLLTFKALKEGTT